ncbi:Hypothetical protein CINCED_3A020922 [Cinara cedri]|uniref:Uncharacterized protein n=1 Tax=Cinara cedri TaxID=506608 RepID=A0A5E4N8X1_9HEMI|nr:Hypothetical protein CINCED_3A020922 [Cinara cedri]
MLNSLRDGQINYGTTNCPSAHVPPHNVVAPIHQNSILPNEQTTSVVYPWNSNPRIDHLYGFHSRYYNLDFPTPYPPATNQYVPPNIYEQNIPQCCQPCCRLRSQNIPKTSPSQVLYNPIRPVQQLNRSYKPKKTLKTPCSEQFLPYIPNDLPVKYDTQNCYQQKYNNSYLNNTNYCPPTNNLWIPPTPNPTWPTERLRPVSRHTGVTSHDFSRNKNYPRLPNYQSNPHPNPTNATHHRPYNYIPSIPDVNDYRPSVYQQNQLIKTHSSDYLSQEQNSRIPISSQNNQIPSSSFQQYYNAPPASYSDISRPSESFKPPQIPPQIPPKSNLNVREFLATWDEGEEETNEKSSESTAPIVVLDCMPVEGDALTKIQEKLNVVSYENLEKVLKENQNPVVINTESNEIDFIQNKAKLPSKPNFEPLDYTKRETGIIKPFITEKKTPPEINTQSEKSYSVNFDGMVAWYGKKNTDISSTDLIEKLADRIFNLSKSQESDGVSFGTAAYTGQITQTNRSIVSSAKDSEKYLQSHQIFDLHHRSEKYIEPSVIYKPNDCNGCNNDSIPTNHSFDSNENNKATTIKSNNTNSSCIVENITKKCLNVTSEQPIPWNLEHSSQEQHLNTSLYDHSVIIKPLDFSSLTDETKGNPFAFDKNTSSINKPNDQYNNVINDTNNYNSPSSNNQHSIQQIDSGNRNFPVIVSPNIHRQEYNGFHESVIQRTGCGDKNKNDKVSPQTDFESMNWNISNDFDKIMKNSHIPMMEPPCMYDRNNYNILDNINSNKNVSNQWKNNVPCVDLTINSKSNSNHDSFFDGWNFIESYENHPSKKNINSPSNNNEVHNPLMYPNPMTSLQESKNKNNDGDKFENVSLGNVKNIPFSKPNDISSNNARSRDVFNLNNRIPDFSDGFELPILNEHHEYMQFKKSSIDSEHRTDGSIFEHLTEPKCNRPTNETTLNVKNDQIKSDNVGLPSFKEKEPLAPMPLPPKLNVVKPIIRDPSQVYTVIKQKVKYDNNSCIDNDNTILNKSGHNLRMNQMNVFNGTDLKSKYNSNIQSNQFDVWSEKFVLKGNLNDSSSAVVQCDVEITQFKSTPENRNTLILKSNIGEHFQDKNTKLLENSNCDLTGVDKININEDDKINTNDFLNCLESTKTDDQKYQDTLDEFETSFGFDMHCNNESNKSFHEDIVDKCLEESIQDQIGEHNVNTTNLTNLSINNIKSSNNIQSPFHCNFQSDYPIKNHFDENKNKSVDLDEKEIINHEKLNTAVFSYHNTIEHDFKLQDNTNINKTEHETDKNLDFNILNDASNDIKQSQNKTEECNSNLLKDSFEEKHDDTNISNTDKNSFNYLTMEDSHFEFNNNKKIIQESTNSKKISDTNNPTEVNDISKKNHCNSPDIDELSNVQTLTTVNDDFKLNINNSNIFETNLITQNTKCTTGTNNNKNNLELSFQYENAENIKNENNNKHIIFQLENNTNIYQTSNFKKIDEFDFEMNYSNSNIYESSNTTNENKIKTQYTYDVNNDEEKMIGKETNINNSLFTEKEHTFEESSSLDCKSNDTHISNGKKTDSINIKNKVIEENNPNHFNSHENLNSNNNAEVENIFRNLCENLTTLNTEKDNSILPENICQNNDNSYDVSKSLRNIENRNESEVIDDNLETKFSESHDKPNETFEECNSVLLNNFINNQPSHLAVGSIKQNELLKEEKTEELMSAEHNSWDPFKYMKNTNENFSDVSIKTIERGHFFTLEEQLSKEIKQSEVELINKNNTQKMQNAIVNTVPSHFTKKILENIKTDLLNAIQNAEKIDSEENCHNNSPRLNSLNHDQQHLTKIGLTDDSVNTRSNPLNDTGLLHKQNTNDVLKVEDLAISKSSFLNCNQKHSNEIIAIHDTTSSESNSLNQFEFPYRQNSDDIFKIIDLSKSGSSLSNSLNDVRFVQNSNDTVEVEDSSKSLPIALNNPEFTYEQQLNDIDKVKESTSFDSGSLNCQQNQNDILEVEDSPISKPIVLNDVDFTLHEYSNKMNDTDDSTNTESNSSDDVEIICKQNFNETIRNGEKHRFSSLNYTESTHQQNSNELFDVDDSNSSSYNSSDDIETNRKQYSDEKIGNGEKHVFNSLNYTESTHQQNSNELFDVDDLNRSSHDTSDEIETNCKQNSNETVSNVETHRFSSLNYTESTHQQNLNALKDVNDSNSFSNDSSNGIEINCEQHSDEMIEIENALKYKSIPLNDTEFSHEQHYNDNNDLTGSVSDSLDDIELTCQQHSNDNLETKNLLKSRPSLLNYEEVISQKPSNEMVEVDDSTSIGENVLNDVELICQQHSNEIAEVQDFSKSGPSSLNHIEITNRPNFNEIVEVNDSNSSNSFDLTCEQHSNEIMADFKVLSEYEHTSLNNIEFTHEPHSNDLIDIDDSTSSECNSLNDVELTCRKHLNDMIEVLDLPESKTTLIHGVGSTFQNYSNEMIEIKNLPESVFTPFNNTKLAHQLHSNEVGQLDKLAYSKSNELNDAELLKFQHNPNKLVDYSTSCSSLDDDELTCQHNELANELGEVEDTYKSGSRILNNNELTHQEHYNDIDRVNVSANFGSNLLDAVKITNQKHSTETVEDPSTFYHTKSVHQQPSKEIVQVNDPICSESNSLYNVQLLKHQYSPKKLIDDSMSNKNSEFVENDNDFKSNNDSCLEKKDSIDEIKLPRVKFILKCHSKTMIKKNVFDEVSIVPYKKLNVAKDEKVIAGHIFKKRINFYKPWISLCKKDIDNSPKEMIKNIVHTKSLTGPEHVSHSNACCGFNNDEENIDSIVMNVPAPEMTFTNEEQCDEMSKIVKDEKSKCVEEVIDSSDTIIVEELVPSVDDILIEKQTFENYGSEKCCEKSLEKDFEIASHKTISKLTKNYVNIRDKFNIRLLARRTNETKRKKRRQWRRKRRQTDNTTGLVVDNGFASKLADDRIELPAAVLRWATTTAAETTNARCKIKVQLPWGRIFNLSNQLDANNYTKLELGPAKVEVRMSETPGEWKLSACRSTTSSKSVVSVRRLVLQRAGTTGGSSKDSSDSGNSTVVSGNIVNDNSSISGNNSSGYSDANSSSSNGSSSRSDGSSDISRNNDGSSQIDCSRKLPKIVIRRNGLNNNYTSYVSCGGFAGGNINEGSPQLTVRLIRDRKLDAMAASGITTLHLKHFIPESDTHDAKRVRYT